METPTPEQFGAIKEFGAGIFGDLMKLDSSILNDQYNGVPNTAAQEFKQNLLVQEQFVKSRSAPVQQVPFYPDNMMPQLPDNIVNPYQEFLKYEQSVLQQPSQRPQNYPLKDQLEFNLDPSQQEITNNLLKEISTKLTKLISLLQSDKDVTKLIPEQKRVPKVPSQFKEDK
jgi:hypothetical protein